MLRSAALTAPRCATGPLHKPTLGQSPSFQAHMALIPRYGFGPPCYSARYQSNAHPPRGSRE